MSQPTPYLGKPSIGLAIALAAITGTGIADEPPPPHPPPAHAPPASMTVEDAMSAMSGMAGEFRRTPNGDVLLYPSVHVDATDTDADPAALVRPVGMSGMQSATEQVEGISAMGGQRGYFRVAPDGRVYFYPYPGNPEGMSGMSGASERER